MGKVFAYARVSTPRQGEGVSLPEQRAAITRYAEQHQLTITQWFEERDTASKTGRRVFMKMLRLLRLKVADGVVIHKIDRSMRNLVDWADIGKLVDAGADIHFASENLDLHSVSGRLSADIQAVVAAHYSRNLREEAKKGFYGRLKQGFYPLRAPIGYLDQGAAKPKVFDPERAPFVREAFERYSTGTVSLPNLVTEMYERGLRNRGGGAVTLNGMDTLLRNPFYVGVVRIYRTGETFQGVHEPLIETKLFEKVQDTLAGKRVDRVQNHVFTYSRLVRCRTCRYSLIGECRKGHVYYRCHNRPFKDPAVCPPTSIREECIDEAVIASLADVDLTADELAVVELVLAERHRRNGEQRSANERALRLHADQIQARLSKLADLLLKGTLEESLYKTKQQVLLLEQAAVRERLQRLAENPTAMLAQVEKAVELAKSPSLLYKTASIDKKRELLKVLLSNFSVSEKNVEITLSLPFRLIAERDRNTKCRARRETCRTWEEILNQIQIYYEKHHVEPSAKG